MKIRFYMSNFTGGAPLSMLNYAKILIQAGHQVTMVAEKAGLETIALYEKEGVQVICRKTASRNPFVLFSLASHMYSAAAGKEADIFLPLATYSNQFFANKVAHRLGKGFLGIVAGGEFEPPEQLIRAMKAPAFICFSRENMESAARLGVPGQDLFLISNRITAAPDPDWRSHFAFEAGKPVRMLTLSRLIPSKVNSIRYVMRLCEYLHGQGHKISLRVGGEGSSFEVLRHEAETINNRCQAEVIQMLGLVTEVKQEIMAAHMVFGKGRSVLEPIMMNRLGVVVGEQDNMCLCLKDNFQNLYTFNFSGREIARQTTIEELSGIIGQLAANQYDFAPAQTAAEQVRLHYDVAHLPEQLLKAFNRQAGSMQDKPAKPVIHHLALAWDVLYYMVVSGIKKLKG